MSFLRERGEDLEKFLELFGNVTVRNLVVVIYAVIFLWKVYDKVSGYFKEKSIRDYEQNKQVQEVIELSKNYPLWRQQSIEKQASIDDKMETMLAEIESLKKANGEGMAYTWRYRILRFNDEVKQGIRHTEEHFNQILEDITKYNRYCGDHKDFPNDKAVLAIKNIRDTYDKRLEENDFL